MKEIIFRLAKRGDLPSIVRMLADDNLGSQRERYEDTCARKPCQASCSLRRPRRRIYLQNAAEDGGWSISY